MPRSNSSVRFITVLPIAALVTAAIFIGMSGMIQTEAVIDDSPRPIIPDVVMGERETNGPVPEDFIRPDDLPTPPAETRPTVDPVDPGPGFNPVGPVAPTGPDDYTTVMPSLVSAILTPAPDYPQSCAARGTEGYAVVEFDVTANGDVVNARILESSHSCFERAALAAIRNWKFRPTVGQTGVVQRGLTKSFIFRLNE